LFRCYNDITGDDPYAIICGCILEESFYETDFGIIVLIFNQNFLRILYRYPGTLIFAISNGIRSSLG